MTFRQLFGMPSTLSFVEGDHMLRGTLRRVRDAILFDEFVNDLDQQFRFPFSVVSFLASHSFIARERLAQHSNQWTIARHECGGAWAELERTCILHGG